MKILDLGRFRQARVWSGDLPDATYPSTHVITHTVAVRCRPPVGKQIIAVELFVPLGARSMYGLIGGQFEPDEKNCLTVDVRVSSSSERLLADSLASKVDEVRVGLPDEYVAAFLSGIDIAQSEPDAVTSGKLLIDCAAHGVMGSNEAIFKNLAIVLLKLLSRASADSSDSELIEMFPHELRY